MTRQLKSSREIEGLQKVIDHSFKHINSSQQSYELSRKLDEETKLLVNQVKDLQHINKFLEVSSPTRANFNNSLNKSSISRHLNINISNQCIPTSSPSQLTAALQSNNGFLKRNMSASEISVNQQHRHYL